MNKKQSTLILFIVIIVIAALLRFVQLGVIPEGFHADEAAFGYNAYSLLKTGKDEYGVSFPLVFQSFGDYKAAIYSYLTIPFIYVLDLTEAAVRLPSAIFGLLFVVLTYFLVKLVSKNNYLSLIATALAAISPVGIVLSRVQSDPLVSIVLFYLGMFAFLLFTKRQRLPFLIVFFLAITLSFFTNTITRLFIVPILGIIGLFYWRSWSNHIKKIFIAVVLSCLIFVAGLFISNASARFSQINVFSSQEVQLPLEEEIREDGMQQRPLMITRVLHNKAVAYGRYLLSNYMDYLSFDFLFQKAEQPQREQLPNMGVLLIIELPFLLFGIYKAFRGKIHFALFSLAWFLTVPLFLSMFNGETPNIHRFFLATLPIHILTALGIQSVVLQAPQRFKTLIITIIGFLFFINVLFFLEQLFIHQPVHEPLYRGYAYKELVQKLNHYYEKYERIIITKGNESPYIYLLFFSQYNPLTYQQSGSHRDLDYQGFDKYLFVPLDCPNYDSIKPNLTQKTLLVRKGLCRQADNETVIDTVYWHGIHVAFQLIEAQPNNNPSDTVEK